MFYQPSAPSSRSLRASLELTWAWSSRVASTQTPGQTRGALLPCPSLSLLCCPSWPSSALHHRGALISSSNSACLLENSRSRGTPEINLHYPRSPFRWFVRPLTDLLCLARSVSLQGHLIQLARKIDSASRAEMLVAR